MTEDRVSTRVIQVRGHVVGPREPMPRNIKPRKLSDFAGVPAVYLEVVRKLSSPLLMGPPVCEELVAFIGHLFTEEEAGVVRHLGLLAGKSDADLAKAQCRTLEEIRPILHRLAFVKRAIAASGPEGRRRYKLMPIFPGIFEMVLIAESPATLSDWHRRFAELFEALYDTGYSLDYMRRRSSMVRFLPIGKAIESHPMALPSDRLEVLLDQYKVFGVGQCQCRMAANMLGHGCGRELSNCASMGEFAKMGIEHGWLKEISKKGLLEVKAQAEADGMVSWLLNVQSAKGQISCSCCGCCCKAMRLVSQFNAPGMMAPPHFLPKFDLAKCTFCGKCARKCPMGSLTVDTQAKTHRQQIERCIGCGLCAIACDKFRAISMEPVPHHQMPYKSPFSMLLHAASSRLWSAWKVWKKYK